MHTVISPRLKLEPSAAELVAGFRRIRDQMGVPAEFPPSVVQEASRVASRTPEAAVSNTARSELDFVTIDPPGSMDLDQALWGSQTSDGYRIEYAIADLGYFVEPGGSLDAESRARGKTLYFPDQRVPLYPKTLSEAAASLLPGKARPAVLWSFDLDFKGNVRQTEVNRALVTVARKLTYQQAQDELDAGHAAETLRVLRTVGQLRQSLERDRGGVDLRLPDQQVKKTPKAFHLTFRTELPVERWNAQISLMTGMAAAELMVSAGTGLLRTLPAPPGEVVQRLRISAKALGVDWPEHWPYQELIRSLESSHPKDAALLSSATALLRGAGYTFFRGNAPSDSLHHAIAAPYAHVTAPLRRMADRLAGELVLRLVDAAPIPDWLLQAMEEAPEIMRTADQRSHELERRVVDYVEAELLQDRIGEEFEAVVVELGGAWGVVQLRDPAVLARCEKEGLSLGTPVTVRLKLADPDEGRVVFMLA